jgi:uncharacterized protein YjiS (DUF1127 family)
MMVGRAERQAAVRRIPRCAEGSSSRNTKPAGSVTTVAPFSRAGMMRQHAHGRVSRANSSWETSMQFEKQLPGHRSPLARAAHRDVTTISLSRRMSSPKAAATLVGRSAALRPHAYSYQQIDLRRGEGDRTSEDRSLRTWPGQGTWSAFPAAMFGLTARVIGGVAACGEVAISGFLLAFMSWTIAQTLAGCAAYAQAMYPVFVDLDEHDPAGGSQPERSEPAPAASPGWGASIASLAGKLQSSMRRGRDRRLAMAELRTLDDRSLRDMGISRYDIEHIARHGDRCE